MNLQRVRKNCILMFPYGFPEAARYRGGAGYIVDLDAPREDVWCAGQLWKLEAAPDAKEASKLEHPQAVREIRAALAEGSKPKVQPEPETVPPSDSSDSLEVARPAAKRKVG